MFSYQSSHQPKKLLPLSGIRGTVGFNTSEACCLNYFSRMSTNTTHVVSCSCTECKMSPHLLPISTLLLCSLGPSLTLPFLDFSPSILATNIHWKPRDSHSYPVNISSHITCCHDSITFYQFLHFCHIPSDNNTLHTWASEMTWLFLNSLSLTNLSQSRYLH